MLSNYLSNSFLYQVYQRDLFQRKKGKRISRRKIFPPPIVNFRIHSLTGFQEVEIKFKKKKKGISVRILSF